MSGQPSAGGAAPTGGGGPRLVVLSRVFPNAAQPAYGVFVRERMSRVAEHLPVTVVAPVPWFPGQGLLRRWRPGYRPWVAYRERQAGVEVLHPRFLCLPGLLKPLDGLLLALGAWPVMRRLARQGRLEVIDAHFIYPDGVAARLLGRWLRRPYTLTLRGTIHRIARTRLRRRLAQRALADAAAVFAVSASLRRIAVELGCPPARIEVVANGASLERFFPEDREACRAELGLPADARVLITVGTLNERKGFHRVIEQLPALLEREPRLRYLAVGGGSPDGDEERQLREQAARLGVADRVHFTGEVAPARLRRYYSAADLFVLATRFEGWANVFLEAAACGLPTVTTDVGGNAEVIAAPWLGRLVPFGDGPALRRAILEALEAPWDREAIVAYARRNGWEARIPRLVERLRGLAGEAAIAPAAGEGARQR